MSFGMEWGFRKSPIIFSFLYYMFMWSRFSALIIVKLKYQSTLRAMEADEHSIAPHIQACFNCSRKNKEAHLYHQYTNFLPSLKRATIMCMTELFWNRFLCYLLSVNIWSVAILQTLMSPGSCAHFAQWRRLLNGMYSRKPALRPCDLTEEEWSSLGLSAERWPTSVGFFRQNMTCESPCIT